MPNTVYVIVFLALAWGGRWGTVTVPQVSQPAQGTNQVHQWPLLCGSFTDQVCVQIHSATPLALLCLRTSPGMGLHQAGRSAMEGKNEAQMAGARARMHTF